jgi:hypothetical protein
MIAMLLAGAAFAAQPLGKAHAAPGAHVCTSSAAGGDWSLAATWTCDTITVPDSTTDVVIHGEVSLAGSAQTVNDLTVTGDGVLYLGADLTINNLVVQDSGILSVIDVKTLTVNGNFTVQSNGLFDPGIGLGALSDQGGAVVFGPGSQVVTLNGATIDFWDLTKQTAGGAPAAESLTFDSGQVHVLHNLTLSGVSGKNLSLWGANPPTQWELNALGTNAIDFVDVRDSNNVSGLQIWVNQWNDSGNNVGWAGQPTTNIVSSANPSTAGSPVTFTVNVPSTLFDGTVAFLDGAAPISGCQYQPINENAGTASCTTSALTVNSHTISAKYSADSSASGSLVQVVQTFGMIVVTSPVNPSLTTDAVTFTAKVMPMAAFSSVVFKDGGASIASCASQAVDPMTGKATCTVTLAGGSHAISADNGKADGDPTQVTSVPFMQNVMISTAVNLAGPSPALKYLGVKATFTASVSPSNATGTVTFQSAGSDIPGCVGLSLTNGQASCDVTQLAAKLHTVTAIYSGDTTHLGSTSNSTNLLVSFWKMFFSTIRGK